MDLGTVVQPSTAHDPRLNTCRRCGGWCWVSREQHCYAGSGNHASGRPLSTPTDTVSTCARCAYRTVAPAYT